MASMFFWLFFTFGVLEVFVAINIVYLRDSKTETASFIPWLVSIQLAAIVLFLIGLVEIFLVSIIGIVIPMVLSLGGIIAVMLYIVKRRKKDTEPIPLLSKILFTCFVLISIAILVVWVIEIIRTVPWIGYVICYLCLPY